MWAFSLSYIPNYSLINSLFILYSCFQTQTPPIHTWRIALSIMLSQFSLRYEALMHILVGYGYPLDRVWSVATLCDRLYQMSLPNSLSYVIVGSCCNLSLCSLPFANFLYRVYGQGPPFNSLLLEFSAKPWYLLLDFLVSGPLAR